MIITKNIGNNLSKVESTMQQLFEHEAVSVTVLDDRGGSGGFLIEADIEKASHFLAFGNYKEKGQMRKTRYGGPIIRVFAAHDGKWAYCPEKVRYLTAFSWSGQFNTLPEAHAAAANDSTIPADAVLVLDSGVVLPRRFTLAATVDAEIANGAAPSLRSNQVIREAIENESMVSREEDLAARECFAIFPERKGMNTIRDLLEARRATPDRCIAITLPNGRAVPLGAYLNSWRNVRAHPHRRWGGWDYWPVNGESILRDILDGVMERIHAHEPQRTLSEKRLWDKRQRAALLGKSVFECRECGERLDPARRPINFNSPSTHLCGGCGRGR